MDTEFSLSETKITPIMMVITPNSPYIFNFSFNLLFSTIIFLPRFIYDLNLFSLISFINMFEKVVDLDKATYVDPILSLVPKSI